MKASLIALLFVAGLPTAEAETSARSTSDSTIECARKNVQRRGRVRRRRGRSRAQQQMVLSLEQPKLKTGPDGSLIPEIRAAAGVIYDPTSGERLWGERADESRPIASITKVMSLLVALEHPRDANELVVIDRTDTRQASKTRLRPRAEVRYGDLLRLAVISSDNAAVRAIARTSPGGAQSFVARMNERARELGLTTMHFEEPTGLDHHNVSSPADLARLMSFAARDERITSLMLTQEATIQVGKRTTTIHNTDRLLGRSDIRVFAGKTGYIDEAGHCFASLVADPVDGRTKAVVVLGANVRPAVFAETRHLLRWATSSAKRELSPEETEIALPTVEAALPSVDAVVAAVEAAKLAETPVLDAIDRSVAIATSAEATQLAEQPEPQGLDVERSGDSLGCTPKLF